jgi:hypothetical protein
MSPGDVLVQIAEIRAKFLQPGLVVEQLEPVENLWNVDNDRRQQRRQSQHKQEQEYLAA